MLRVHYCRSNTKLCATSLPPCFYLLFCLGFPFRGRKGWLLAFPLHPLTRNSLLILNPSPKEKDFEALSLTNNPSVNSVGVFGILSLGEGTVRIVFAISLQVASHQKIFILTYLNKTIQVCNHIKVVAIYIAITHLLPGVKYISLVIYPGAVNF